MSPNHSFFFVTGMFRSGTTLFARMFNTHTNLVLASDPFAPLFKAFRNEIAFALYGERYDNKSPLHDYYFESGPQSLFRKLKESDFHVFAHRTHRDKLIETIKEHAEPYSPKIIPYLHFLKGETFHELFECAYGILKKAYGENEQQIVGMKEVWSGEFTGQILTSFPAAKVIHIVRDPRAVVASNLSSEGPYPLLFLGRQWRKLASLAWSDEQSLRRCLVVKYENLICNPMEESQRICRFLNVPFEENLVSPAQFKDGRNAAWAQNTSYQKGGQGFNVTSVERWKDVLTQQQIETIEFLCGFEMELFQYALQSDRGSMSESQLLASLETSKSNFADWIKTYTDYDLSQEIQKETKRYQTLKRKHTVSVEDQRAFCLLESVYAAVSR